MALDDKQSLVFVIPNLFVMTELKSAAHKLWERLDQVQDGTLTLADLEQLARKVKVDGDAALYWEGAFWSNMLAYFDIDGNKEITKDEFFVGLSMQLVDTELNRKGTFGNSSSQNSVIGLINEMRGFLNDSLMSILKNIAYASCGRDKCSDFTVLETIFGSSIVGKNAFGPVYAIERTIRDNSSDIALDIIIQLDLMDNAIREISNEAFDRLDTDSNGFLNPDDLRYSKEDWDAISAAASDRSALTPEDFFRGVVRVAASTPSAGLAFVAPAAAATPAAAAAAAAAADPAAAGRARMAAASVTPAAFASFIQAETLCRAEALLARVLKAAGRLTAAEEAMLQSAEALLSRESRTRLRALFDSAVLPRFADVPRAPAPLSPPVSGVLSPGKRAASGDLDRMASDNQAPLEAVLALLEARRARSQKSDVSYQDFQQAVLLAFFDTALPSGAMEEAAGLRVQGALLAVRAALNGAFIPRLLGQAPKRIRAA